MRSIKEECLDRLIPLGERLCLANIAGGQKLLTLASPLGTLRVTRDVFRTGAAIQSASSTRRDLCSRVLPCATS